ncbi:MAG: Adenylate cyclase [Labilithrix sp.]|nr:Adenylate cyclase [Labilithrix sp.]
MTFRLRFGLEEVDLADGETTIGRDASCTITIEDTLVSRTHASFRRGHDGQIEVTDLGSRNGTRVNGAVIREPTRLTHGDRVRIGGRELVFYDTEREAQVARRVPRMEAPTGRMALCVACAEIIPGETPSCPHCGAAQDAD